MFLVNPFPLFLVTLWSTYLENIKRLEYGRTGGGKPAAIASSIASWAALSASSRALAAAASAAAFSLKDDLK